MTFAILLSLCLGGLPQAFSPQADALLIRVRIQTDEWGQVDDVAERRESIRHLVSAIAGRKKPGLVLVSNPEDSVDVVVSVEGRSVTVPKVVIGLSGGMGSPTGRPAPAPPVRAAQLRVTFAIARDGDPVEITNKNRANDSEAGWRSAAEDVVKQLEKWITQHRAAILEARRRITSGR